MSHYVDKADLRHAEILLSLSRSKPGLKVCYHEVQPSSYSYLKYLPIKKYYLHVSNFNGKFC